MKNVQSLLLDNHRAKELFRERTYRRFVLYLFEFKIFF